MVVGGAGALGKTLVSRLIAAGLTTTSVDLFKNAEASRSVELDVKSDWTDVGARVTQELKALHVGGVHAVFHVAGGWVGGGVTDPEFLGSVDRMWKLNVQSAALTASIAGRAWRSRWCGSFDLRRSPSYMRSAKEQSGPVGLWCDC